MNAKNKWSFAAPFLMFDDSDAGGTPPPKEEGKDAPHAEGNGGLSQKDVDRLLGERAARAAETERKKLWESLGVTTQDEFDAFLKAKKETEDKAKTDLQKLMEQADAEKKRADKLAEEKQTETEALYKRITDGEIKLLASKAVTDKDGAIVRAAFHPDVLEDIPTLINRAGIKDENGKMVGIEEALAELAKAKPRLLADDQTPPTEHGTPPSKPKAKLQKQDTTTKPKWTL